MKHVIALAMLTALLQGCATRFDFQEPGAEGGLRFQTSAVAPRGDEAAVPQDTLEPGDIILTSAPTLRSVGIRLFTLSSVSHAALYVGDGRIVEAVGSGVHERPLDGLLREENVALVLRYPGLTRDQQLEILDYALQKTGARFSYFGATLHLPFSFTRRVCELPLVPGAVRDACLRALGVLSYAAATESQLFCSQLVMQAYQHAGVHITDADARLISPADILHMREGDVPSVRVSKPLRYVGYLRYEPTTLATLGQ
jgi:uncharacterized protein YycO